MTAQACGDWPCLVAGCQCGGAYNDDMHLDSILPTLRDTFNLGSAGEPESVKSVTNAGADEICRAFDPTSDRDWHELIRDIAALANSGGGRIVVGARVDEKDVLERLARFTGFAFDGVVVRPIERTEGPSVTIVVGPAVFPLGFGQQGVNAGSGFYFRHGERSEPGTTADMRAFVERLLRRVRRRWLRGIRRVLAGPVTIAASAAPKRAPAERVKLERAVLQPVRIVTDPNAPALQPQDVDRLYPWRQKDLLRELNTRLGGRLLNSYDIQAVRRHHRLDERPDFVFYLPGAGRRYSPAVAEWIMSQYERDPEFFHLARVADQATLKLRRQKPR